jgi:putative transcriptional regulator
MKGSIKLISKMGELRRSKGLQQNFVAKELGISQSLLSDYENGRNFPRLDKAYVIADYYNVKITDLHVRENEGVQRKES